MASKGTLSITARGKTRRYVVDHAVLTVQEPSDETVEDVPDGQFAVQLSIGTKAGKHKDGRAPSITIGPLYRELKAVRELVGVIALPSGYDQGREAHVATRYDYDHDTFGPTTITIRAIDARSATVEIVAQSPDTNYYDHRARDGTWKVKAKFRVVASALRARKRAVKAKPKPRAQVVRVAPAKDVVAIWLGERTSIRDLRRYITIVDGRSPFVDDCGVDTIAGAKIWHECSAGSNRAEKLLDLFASPVFYGPAFCARVAATTAGKLFKAYLVLPGYRVLEPWPDDAPVGFVGNF